MEYKGSMNVTGKLFDSPLRIKDGMINVSTKPGLGIVNANELFKDAKKV
jgi:L-alanine-DL-glutamate epimerase-like enolase superfamily enzyme